MKLYFSWKWSGVSQAAYVNPHFTVFKESYSWDIFCILFYKTKINVICFLKTTSPITVSNAAWVWELKLYLDTGLIGGIFLPIPLWSIVWCLLVVIEVNLKLPFLALFASHWGPSSSRTAHTLICVHGKPKTKPTKGNQNQSELVLNPGLSSAYCLKCSRLLNNSEKCFLKSQIIIMILTEVLWWVNEIFYQGSDKHLSKKYAFLHFLFL